MKLKNMLFSPLRYTGRRVWKKENRYAWNLFKESIQPERPVHVGCGGQLRPVAGDPLSRKCDRCNEVIPLEDLHRARAAELQFDAPARTRLFLRRATIMFFIACSVVSAFALISAWQGSPMLFFAALILSAPLFMSVFAMRYRAWQATTGRYFEAQAPLSDFIRAELNLFFGPRR